MRKRKRRTLSLSLSLSLSLWFFSFTGTLSQKKIETLRCTKRRETHGPKFGIPAF
jgi:hypothetical protein